MIIYKTTNLINNKIYIGQDSKNNYSYLGSGQNIKRAIKKYGKENFKKEILEKCENLKQLNEREKYWIEFYNSMDKNIGYNLSLGGDSNLGYKFTKEQRLNVSKANKGKPKPNVSKTRLKLFKEGKLISPMKGKTKEDEIVKKIQEKRVPTLKNHFADCSIKQWNKGKKNCYGKQQLKNISDGLKKYYKENGHPIKGKKFSQEHKENLSKAHMGHKRSKESIEKQLKTREQRKLQKQKEK